MRVRWLSDSGNLDQDDVFSSAIPIPMGKGLSNCTSEIQIFP